jgi:hypothetical protein
MRLALLLLALLVAIPALWLCQWLAKASWTPRQFAHGRR